MFETEAAKIFQIFQAYPFQIAPKFCPPLANYTSFRCAGKAYGAISLANCTELCFFLQQVKTHQIPWLLLGRGSNCIFTDHGFKGVLCLLKGEFQSIQLIPENPYQISVGAGLLNRKLTIHCKKLNWSGAEFLATVPGTVGGSVVMNAGAFDQEIQTLVNKVYVVDDACQPQVFTKKECNFSYRTSVFQQKKCVLHKIELQLNPGNKAAIESNEQRHILHRQKTQPVRAATWGSVFKNPPSHKAGYLIEQCGLKGKRFGQVQISPLHANFIENLGNGTYHDIQIALKTIRNEVQKKFGLVLEPEVKIYDPYGKLCDITAMPNA